MNTLRFKAPRRHWFRTANGLWASQPWLRETKQAAEQAGAWFGNSNEHDFA